jgi:hypothetical protein
MAKKDMHYCFIDRCSKPIYSDIIDDEWRKEKFEDLDIELPQDLNIKFSMDNADDLENDKCKSIPECKTWADSGTADLILPYTEFKDHKI